MKVILYCASTVNGMCAKVDGDSDWVSSEDTTSFNAIVRATGCAIMGRKSFDIFNTMPVSDWPNADGPHIVLTHNATLSTTHPSVYFVSSPQAALAKAQDLNLLGVVVVGGGQTFGSFMQEKLVDELFIDIEPLAIGRGIPLFNAGEFESKLELLATKSLSPQTIQLHYKVIKV